MKVRSLLAVAAGVMACSLVSAEGRGSKTIGPPMPPIDWISPRALQCFTNPTPLARVCFNIGIIRETVVIRLNGYDISRFFRNERNTCLSVPLRENWGLNIGLATCGREHRLNVIQIVAFEYNNDDPIVSTRFFYVNIGSPVGAGVEFVEPRAAVDALRAMWNGIANPHEYRRDAALEADKVMTDNPVISAEIVDEVNPDALMSLSTRGYGVRVGAAAGW